MRRIDQAILFLAHARKGTVFTPHDLVEILAWPDEQKGRDVVKILKRYGFIEKVGADLRGHACYRTTEDGTEIIKSRSQNETERAVKPSEENKE